MHTCSCNTSTFYSAVISSSPQVQPITLLKFDYKLEHTQQVAISSSYICYGLKAGHIRTLNRNTASRALFKGHPTSLSHMAFFSASDNLLASASRQGDLAVRLVTDDKGPDGDTVPAETLLMRAQLQLPPGADTSSSSSPLVSLAWHPSTPQILAAGAAGSVNIFEVPTTPPAEQPPALVGPGIQYTLPSSDSSAAAVTAVAFSPAGDLLVAADSAGSVHMWWLEGDGEEGEAPLLSWRPFSGSNAAAGAAAAAAVASVQFLHQAGDGSSILMTGDACNAALKLWVLPPAAALSGASLSCLQTVQLTASSKGPSDVFCHVVVQRELQLVVLANTVRKQVYTLHYSLGSNAAASVTAAPAVAFDYAAFWGVKQPILSLATGLEAVESQAVPGEVAQQQLLLYTVQTDAIQQYFINPALCSSSSGSESEVGVATAPADAASSAAGEAAAAAAAADVEEGEEVSSSITAPPADVVPAPAAAKAAAAPEPEPAAEAAAAAAAEADAPVAAAVPPPAQLPTPGLLLHAKASEQQEAPTKEAATADAESAAAAGTEATAASSAAAAAAGTPAADSEKQQEGAATAVHKNASTTTVVPVQLPPMPTSSLLHSAEKAPVAAIAATKKPEDAEESAAAEASASTAAAAAVPAAAGASADVAALQQQVAQLLEMQQVMAAQLQANSQQTVAGKPG
jgi:enhancer of mRNA-decapping protein 4